MAGKEEANISSNEVDVSHLLKSVRSLHETLKDGIEKNSEADVETNTSSLLGRTGGAAIRAYGSVFKSLQVTSRSAFEGLFQKFFHFPEVQECYDELLELEHVQALKEHQDAIKSLNAEIVVISFGSPIGVRMWLDSTGCPFDVLCDEKREVYKSFGLKVSLSKVWNIEVVTHYGERLASNQNLHKKYENVEDDPLQMGGDFILDKNGCLAWIHASEKATDRPTIEQIITALKNL